MSVSNSIRKAGAFVGDGTQTQFPFAFKCFHKSDVSVVKISHEQEQTLELDRDYVVQLNAGQDDSPGGSVQLNTPLGQDEKLIILGNRPYYQRLELTNRGGFYPDVINDALDHIVILIQQLLELNSRSLKLKLSQAQQIDPSMPEAKAGHVLVWNDEGNALKNLDPEYISQAWQEKVAQATRQVATAYLTEKGFDVEQNWVDFVQSTFAGVLTNMGVDPEQAFSSTVEAAIVAYLSEHEIELSELWQARVAKEAKQHLTQYLTDKGFDTQANWTDFVQKSFKSELKKMGVGENQTVDSVVSDSFNRQYAQHAGQLSQTATQSASDTVNRILAERGVSTQNITWESLSDKPSTSDSVDLDRSDTIATSKAVKTVFDETKKAMLDANTTQYHAGAIALSERSQVYRVNNASAFGAYNWGVGLALRTGTGNTGFADLYIPHTANKVPELWIRNGYNSGHHSQWGKLQPLPPITSEVNDASQEKLASALAVKKAYERADESYRKATEAHTKAVEASQKTSGSEDLEGVKADLKTLGLAILGTAASTSEHTCTYQIYKGATVGASRNAILLDAGVFHNEASFLTVVATRESSIGTRQATSNAFCFTVYLPWGLVESEHYLKLIVGVAPNIRSGYRANSVEVWLRRREYTTEFVFHRLDDFYIREIHQTLLYGEKENDESMLARLAKGQSFLTEAKTSITEKYQADIQARVLRESERGDS